MIFMKYVLAGVLNLFLLFDVFAQTSTNIITTDIDNFWIAYDKITATKDRAEQLDYINELYIEKGSPGLKAIMQARRYTDKSYIDAINIHPLFWKSIRANTLKSRQVAKEIEVDVAKIKKIYPDLKPAKVYFTIGAFRTGGTAVGNMVLFGSELAMADPTTVSTEFSAQYSNLKNYFATNPIANIVQLGTHEYVHTQQKTTIADTLLGQAVMEGVAEFVAFKAAGKPHAIPEPFRYGKQNKEKVSARFAAQMYDQDTGIWFYSNAENEFKTRDLGYYVGYAICEEYYKKSADKKLAIKEMIELDYNNINELEKFVEESGYFVKPIALLKQEYKAEYEKNRPTVVNIAGIKNGSQNVSPNVTQITIEFSTKMKKEFRSFDFGPLGEDSALRVKKLIGFAEDGKSITIEVELKPDKRYQMVLERGFRNENNIRLIPYLIDFKTAAQ
jgi:hypothetical protein